VSGSRTPWAAGDPVPGRRGQADATRKCGVMGVPRRASRAASTRACHSASRFAYSTNLSAINPRPLSFGRTNRGGVTGQMASVGRGGDTSRRSRARNMSSKASDIAVTQRLPFLSSSRRHVMVRPSRFTSPQLRAVKDSLQPQTGARYTQALSSAWGETTPSYRPRHWRSSARAWCWGEVVEVRAGMAVTVQADGGLANESPLRGRINAQEAPPPT
jgi:hypothetical protein